MTAPLTAHERRVLDDFCRRGGLPATVTLIVSGAGVLVLLLADVEQWIAVATSALCGALVGAWIEKRHLHDLAGAVRKILEFRG